MELSPLDQIVSFLFDPLRIGLLVVGCFLAMCLEVQLVLRVDVETVTHRRPFGFIDKFVGSSIQSMLVCCDPVVDINVINPQSTLLRQQLYIDIVTHDVSVGFKSLWSLLWC